MHTYVFDIHWASFLVYDQNQCFGLGHNFSNPHILLTFQSTLLFTNVIMDSVGIDYHVILAENLFQQCLDNLRLQQEFLCVTIHDIFLQKAQINSCCNTGLSSHC